MSRTNEFEVIHLDKDFIIVNKRAGVLTVPGRNTDDPANVLDSLRAKFGHVLPVHRIDRHTSGLVVFARHTEIQRMLSIQFLERGVKKRYLAIVAGNPPPSGSLAFPLLSVRGGRTRVDPKGKPSHTDYRVVEAFRGFALLECLPLTGRQHQIRAHLQHFGYPLAVDPVYGGASALDISSIKTRGLNRPHDEEARPLLTRTPLHACRVTFAIADGRMLSFEAPLPKDMRACLAQLRKWRRM